MTSVLVPTFVFNCVLAEKFISRDYPVANSAVEKPLDASWDVTTMCWGWAFVFRKTRIKTKLGSLRSWVTCAAADGVNKGEGSSLFLRWFPRHLLPASSLALSHPNLTTPLSLALGVTSWCALSLFYARINEHIIAILVPSCKWGAVCLHGKSKKPNSLSLELDGRICSLMCHVRL